MSWKRAQLLCWFCIFKRLLVPCASLRSVHPIHWKSGPHPSGQNRSPERGGCQRPTDACWPGSWQWPSWLWNDSDKSGSSWLISNQELSSKTDVGWSRWSSTAEWLIMKVVTGLKVWRLEQGVSLCLFCPNTVEARDLRDWLWSVLWD